MKSLPPSRLPLMPFGFWRKDNLLILAIHAFGIVFTSSFVVVDILTHNTIALAGITTALVINLWSASITWKRWRPRCITWWHIRRRYQLGMEDGLRAMQEHLEHLNEERRRESE